MLGHDAANAVCQRLAREGRMTAYEDDQKIKATAAIFGELHEWAKEKLPMGASAEVSEEVVRKGLKAVRNKVSKMTEEECEQSYGVPVLLILGLIPTLVSWIQMLLAWWNGKDE